MSDLNFDDLFYTVRGKQVTRIQAEKYKLGICEKCRTTSQMKWGFVYCSDCAKSFCGLCWVENSQFCPECGLFIAQRGGVP